jgi:hypothetical protein
VAWASLSPVRMAPLRLLCLNHQMDFRLVGPAGRPDKLQCGVCPVELADPVELASPLPVLAVLEPIPLTPALALSAVPVPPELGVLTGA